MFYFAVQKYTLCRKLLLPFGKILTNGKYASGVFLQSCDNQAVAERRCAFCTAVTSLKVRAIIIISCKSAYYNFEVLQYLPLTSSQSCRLLFQPLDFLFKTLYEMDFHGRELILYPFAVFVVFGVCLMFRDFSRDCPGMGQELFAGK